VRSLARHAWDVDAFVAERIGDRRLKARLEDAAARVLEPEAFERIRRRLAEDPRSGTEWISATRARIAGALEAAGTKALSIEHRIKNPGGVLRKMRSKLLPFEMVQDVYAFRVIVDDEPACYAALGALHAEFRPSLLRFKDYVRDPKPNGYQSLHTTVTDETGAPFELQVRTAGMHARSLAGEAAHWTYKIGPSPEGNGGREEERS
jgi:(p)ppGpp synthase/HD superfamily hydrolase